MSEKIYPNCRGCTSWKLYRDDIFGLEEEEGAGAALKMILERLNTRLEREGDARLALVIEESCEKASLYHARIPALSLQIVYRNEAGKVIMCLRPICAEGPDDDTVLRNLLDRILDTMPDDKTCSVPLQVSLKVGVAGWPGLYHFIPVVEGYESGERPLLALCQHLTRQNSNGPTMKRTEQHMLGVRSCMFQI